MKQEFGGFSKVLAPEIANNDILKEMVETALREMLQSLVKQTASIGKEGYCE